MRYGYGRTAQILQGHVLGRDAHIPLRAHHRSDRALVQRVQIPVELGGLFAQVVHRALPGPLDPLGAVGYALGRTALGDPLDHRRHARSYRHPQL
ncbi:hypothetical protein SDC9_144920 [bioreactor metagenome]|uniref:Uncharacterized protein n=1 Tax=bioreactor metagenome TaxID=1076179 RepID=A0A645EA97_9ZZZZ